MQIDFLFESIFNLTQASYSSHLLPTLRACTRYLQSERTCRSRASADKVFIVTWFASYMRS